MTPKEWRWVKGMLGFTAHAAYKIGYAAARAGEADQSETTPAAFTVSKKAELVMQKSLQGFVSGKKGG